MTHPTPQSPDATVLPELEEELSHFRREWLEESRRRQPAQPVDAPLPLTQQHSQPVASSPPRHRDTRRDSTTIEGQLEGLALEERWKPKTALELYEIAVLSEREGRLSDALTNYRAAFRKDPDVDKAYHRASLAPQSSRASEPHPSTSSTLHDFKFERTIQLAPDYVAEAEHRSVEAVERGTGSVDEDSTHPSSTAFLYNSLVRSIAANPWERPASTLDSSSVSAAPPPSSVVQPMTPEEACAQLAFIPADPDLPLPLATLPREVLLFLLRCLSLSSVLPFPRSSHSIEGATPAKGKRGAHKRSLKEEMAQVQTDLELEDVDREWKTDVEALERFAKTCRAARVLTLDAGVWRDLCLRTYVPPHQISREEDATQLVALHSNDWRRFYIEHPRIRFDGAFISVVTYLRRGENHSWYSPTHLITFYRYLRFYHTGLVVSLLTVDAPATVVRGLNPALRVKGLTLGRWRLRGEQVEIWGLEDPGVEESRRKYSFRMTCRLKSTARGRMNKLEMILLATEHRQTLELEPVPIRPTKPFFFSKVASYAGEDLE